jgi:hypothetical protein
MSGAVYLVPEPSLVEIPVIDGKALSNALEDLDVLALTLGLEPLSSFVHVTNDDLKNAGIDLMDFLIPQAQWFEAENILETVFALRVHLEKHSKAIPKIELVMTDLKALELALEVCENHHVRVRLTIDI